MKKVENPSDDAAAVWRGMGLCRAVWTACVVLALGVAAGCAHPPKRSASTPSVPSAETPDAGLTSPLAAAESYFAEGRYAEALVECVNLTRRDPHTPGLAELRSRVLAAELDQRAKYLVRRSALSDADMALDAREKALVPDSYGRVRRVEGERGPVRTEPTAMQRALAKPVTMHLKAVDLGTFIDAVSKDQNINMIADKGLGGGKQLDIEMDNVPLAEVLDYLSRNLGVEFYVGQNVIWVTAAKPEANVPLETRIYRLRSGIQFHGGDWAEAAAKAGAAPAERDVLGRLTDQATELAKRETALEEAIKKFVPTAQGAQSMMDRNAHVLIVRNSRANLAMVEDILAALDVSPPQVLIEARFVETTVADLRELGIEWLMDSAATLSGKRVSQDGRTVALTQTQLDKGGGVTFDPYGYDSAGTFPLGPQGAFGEYRPTVNPLTAVQGLNLIYRGVLTDPMFNAVLHALDISGKGRTLSVPRVTTVNNNPAKLRNGQDLLYFNEFQAQAFNLVDAAGQRYTVTVLIPKGGPVKEELGITLVAVPSVGADMKTISLMLMPTISELDGWTDYQSISGTNAATTRIDIQQVVAKLPVIQRREVQTKAIVNSGETVVLGGLIDTVRQETLHEVPFLSGVPLIGNLFRRLDVTEQNRNLLIFVTATVISERGEQLLPLGG